MADVSAKIKGLNVEFNDNLNTSPNIESGHDIKTSFARIHKRFSDMKGGAYEDIADQYYPSGTGSEKLVTGEIVASALENVTTDIEQINYALTHLSEQFDAEVKTNITTGYYISGIQVGDNWTEHMDEDESSQYLEEALYLGARQINKNLKLTVADHRSTSVRCFGFCDENDIVTSYYKESWDIWEQNSDGTYTATMPIDAPYFFFSYSDLEVLGLEITEDLLNRTGYVSPNGSDDNGGSTMGFAFKTVNKALSSGCDRIILAGGKYFQQINLGLATGNHIEFISYDRTTRPVFYDPDAILVESATLSSGIYSATIEQSISSNNLWLYQDNVGDVETQIAESERLPVQRGKNYRLEDTRIEKCYADNLSDALDEISESSICKWYLDGTTLYFTSHEAPSSTNPICISTGKDLFSNANRSISVKMSGIKCKYISLNLKNLCNAEAIDCCATNVFGWGAITWDNTLNAYFLRCEASSCSNGTNGDGFNADVTNTGEAFSKHYTATLIDCWSHDNTDDGYSDHRHAETTIIGGLFEYNGKAGLTPVHGAHCSCYNVYSRKNYTGFMCTGDVEEAEGGKYTQMICYNCVAELNNRAGNETGFYVDGLNNRMTLISCKAIGNPTAYYVGQTASIKLVDCTAFDNNRFLHGYPENATVENTGLYRYIPQGSDLNDFSGTINVGNYLCPTSRVTTILNKPTGITTAFKMDVYNYNDQTMQIIYPNDDLCLFYVRLYNGTTWSNWKESATAMQILSYGNSTWNDFITVYNKNAVVYCRASSNSNPATGSQTRMAFMAYVNNGTDPTEVEFQYYRSVSSHTDNQQGDQVFVYKLNKTNGWSVTTRNAFSKINVTSPIVKNYASQQITLSHADSGVTAGTYRSVTVDAQGHVTAGTNPDTLVGYGITDASISNGTITLGSNTLTPPSQEEVNVIANTGAKNQLPITTASTTHKGITFTVNNDGTITVNGTNDGTGASIFDVSSQAICELANGDYILSGCPSNGSTAGYRMDVTRSTGSAIQDTGSGALFTVGGSYTVDKYRIIVNSGMSVDHVVFYPMIRRAEITDSTFVPYGMTNAELTEEKIDIEDVFGIGKFLTSGDSMDSLPIGKFVCENATTAANVINNPWSDSGFFGHTERSVSSSARFIQVAYRNDDSFTMAKRRYYGTWSPWIYSTNYIASATGSIFDYADSLPTTTCSVYFARQSSSSGSGKPVAGRRYIYQIMIYTSSTATIMAYEGEDKTIGHVYMATKTSSAWGSWIKMPARDEIDVIANLGAKNLFNINTNEPLKIYHTTYTLTDGSLTVTSNGAWGHYSVPVNLPAGKYIFTTTISNFSKDASAAETAVRMRVTDTTATGGIEIASKAVTGNGDFEFPFTWTGGQCYIQYYPNFNATSYTSSFTASNSMIRRAEITDATFQQYALSNPVITPAAIKAVDEGSKNRFLFDKSVGTTETIHGRTFTIQSDGGVKIETTGTVDADADFYVLGVWSNTSVRFDSEGETWTPVCSCATKSDDISFRIYNRSTGSTVASRAITSLDNAGSAFDFDLTCAFIKIGSGQTIPSGGIVVYPMICTTSAWAVSQKYAPYAPTNRELNDAVGVVANAGAKNIFKPNYKWLNSLPYETTVSNVTIKYNGDNTFTLNGTASADNYFLILGSTPLKNDYLEWVGKRLTVSIITDGNIRDLSLYRVESSSTSTLIAPNTETTITFNPVSSSDCNIGVRFLSGASFTNTTVKVMIRPAEIIDDTFIPYAPSNRELYEEKAEQTELNAIANQNVKNLFYFEGVCDTQGNSFTQTYENNGVTYVVESEYFSDGSVGTVIYLSGATTSSSSYALLCTRMSGTYYCIDQYCDGNYILSGCPEGGSTSSYKLVASSSYDGTAGYEKIDTGNGVILSDRGSYSYICIAVEIAPNTDCTGLVFRPMIRRKEITDSTFTAYSLPPSLMTQSLHLFNENLSWMFENYTKKSDVFGNGTKIPDNANLNNYTTEGKYYGVNSTGNTVSGLPVANGQFHFTLLVMKDTTSYLYQYLTICKDANNHQIFRRKRYNSTWSKWYTFNANNIAFGTCDSAADAQTKVVTISDSNWTKVVGGIIAVKFTNSNTFSATADSKIKLSVGGEVSEIYYNNTNANTGTNTTCYGYANRYIYYMWDGTYWVWVSHGVDNNTTYSGMTDAEVNAGTGTTNRLITPARLNKAIRGICTSLTSGQDLNNLKTIGSYYTSTNSIANSCLHRPAYSDPSYKRFRLEVKNNNTATSSFMQILYTQITSSVTGKGDIEIFYRGYYDGTWGSWRKVTDTTVSDYTGS